MHLNFNTSNDLGSNVTNLTKSSIKNRNIKIKVTKSRRNKRQSNIKKTSDQFKTNSSELTPLESHLKKRLPDAHSAWDQFYFGSAESFVKLIDYKDMNFTINPDLKGIAIHRIEREHIAKMKDCIRQMTVIVNHLDKKYKQDLLDSFELTDFVRNILELGEFGNQTKVNSYGFASNVFYLTMKILIENAPKPIQNHMIKSIEAFIDMNNLPLELGFKRGQILLQPVAEKNRTGDLSIRLEIK